MYLLTYKCDYETGVICVSHNLKIIEKKKYQLEQYENKLKTIANELEKLENLIFPIHYYLPEFDNPNNESWINHANIDIIFSDPNNLFDRESGLFYDDDLINRFRYSFLKYQKELSNDDIKRIENSIHCNDDFRIYEIEEVELLC